MMEPQYQMDKLMMEDAHRLFYFRPTAVSNLRDDAFSVHRSPGDFKPPHEKLQPKVHFQTFLSKRRNLDAPVSSVSKRNARERKRVRQVNLGFSALRERVPQGGKNKKLSKLEILRSATEYIRQMHQILGIPPSNENFGPLDECSSADEPGLRPGGSGADLSPASSHPSEGSLVSPPYPPQQGQDDQLYDIGAWFSQPDVNRADNW